MQTWKTRKCIIHEELNKQNIIVLDVYNHDKEYLGTITPQDAQTFIEMIEDLNAGCCPIADNWFSSENGEYYFTKEGWSAHD